MARAHIHTGKKRTSDGREKLSKGSPSDASPANDTPPGAQVPRSSTSTTASTAASAAKASPDHARATKKQKLEKPPVAPVVRNQSEQAPSRKSDRRKLPRLPSNASVTKRPLHHPAIPTPFASSDQPKVLYISQSTPFIPTLKRIRRLLLETSKRLSQSQAAQNSRYRQPARRPKTHLVSNGRLAPEDVEREIAEEGRDKGRDFGGEEVYVKATGRAIESALKIGLHFQGESDCRVRVEMGSVMAVDDIEVRSAEEEEERGLKSKQKENEEAADIPETRVRMVSSVTVAIGLS